MKRVVLLFNVILLALTIDYLAENSSLYIDSKNKNSIKNEIFIKESKLKFIENEINEKNKELKDIEDKKSTEVRILKVWEKELEKTHS